MKREKAISFVDELVLLRKHLLDEQASLAPNIFPIFPNGVNENGEYEKEQIILDETNNQLYRVVQEKVKPLENQPPHGEGMLAVYRPIVVEHKGTVDDPIPWVYGMDCYEEKYYSYKEHIYKVDTGGSMIPCLWPPDSEGLWQWILVQ